MPSRLLYAIDPGPVLSALVVLGLESPPVVLQAEKMANERLLALLWSVEPCGTDALVIEQIAGMGLAVGAEVFETCFWTGRFVEAWDGAWHRVTRRQVKLNLCGHMRAKDPHIRQVLIDRFGPTKPKAIGTKKAPGPLYGVAGDCWSALAVGITWRDEQLAERTVSQYATLQ